MPDTPHPGVVLVVKFGSSLPFDEVKKRYEARMPEFRALPGLLQKYYVHERSTGDVAGIYLWDSQESLDAYLASDLRKSIPAAYEVEGVPRAEAMEVVDILREELF